MSQERSVIWAPGKSGDAIIENKGTLRVLIQKWDLVGDPVFLEIFERHVGEDEGQDRPLGWVIGSIQKEDIPGKKGQVVEKYWLEPTDPKQLFKPNEKLADEELRAEVNVKIPTGLNGKKSHVHKRIKVEVRGGTKEGRYEIGLRVRPGDMTSILEPPADRPVTALVGRDLNDPKILELFTPSVSQVEKPKPKPKKGETFVTESGKRKQYKALFGDHTDWNNVPKTPLGFGKGAGDFDQLGCGHISLALSLRYWGEFDDPIEFINDHLKPIMFDMPLRDPGEEQEFNAAPFRVRHSEGHWGEDIGIYPNEGARACLLWAWWYRRFIIMEHVAALNLKLREFPEEQRAKKAKRLRSGVERIVLDYARDLNPGILKFPAHNTLKEKDLPEEERTYDVVPTRNFSRIIDFLGQQPPVPVILLLRMPSHYVLAVGFENVAGRPQLIVHDSGNSTLDTKHNNPNRLVAIKDADGKVIKKVPLKEKLEWSVFGRTPKGFGAWPSRLYALPKKELYRTVTGKKGGRGQRLVMGYAIRRRNPPEHIRNRGWN